MLQEQLNSYRNVIAHLSLEANNQEQSDLTVLTYMAHAIAELPCEVAQQPEPIYPFFTYREEPFHAFHRMILYSPLLPAGQDVPFVGFISQRQPQISAELAEKLNEVDKLLVLELASHGDLLNYSSLQLHDGNWFNLVQFVQETGKETLLATKTHQHAAYELAPRYYRWIRLHHGTIAQGNPDAGLYLHRTKYYTFQPSSPRPDIRIHTYEPAHGLVR